MKHKTKIIIISAVCGLAVIAVTVFALFFFGILQFNDPDVEVYPVRGVDLSHYQGEVDWEVLEKQGVDFAYIKATEGSSYVDPFFEDNFKNASGTGLRVGAYHFFSFETPGETQAELFIETVEKQPDMLPPAVDVEFYGGFSSENTDIPKVKTELRVLVDRLTFEYGMKPVVYATYDTYSALVNDDFSDCGLWIRSVYSPVKDGIEWMFWQYSNRRVLDGYDGESRYIDMNVFNGSKEEFAAYPK